MFLGVLLLSVSQSASDQLKRAFGHGSDPSVIVVLHLQSVGGILYSSASAVIFKLACAMLDRRVFPQTVFVSSLISSLKS